jgi:hypothetical protein
MPRIITAINSAHSAPVITTQPSGRAGATKMTATTITGTQTTAITQTVPPTTRTSDRR